MSAEPDTFAVLSCGYDHTALVAYGDLLRLSRAKSFVVYEFVPEEYGVGFNLHIGVNQAQDICHGPGFPRRIKITIEEA